MNIKPATTGDTENGRSINVMSSVLPRNSNLAIAHAAARPKTTLSGTLIAAMSKVSFIAAHASGCEMRLPITAPAFRERLRKHVDQRQQQKHEAERHRDADERPLGQRRFFRAALGFGATGGEFVFLRFQPFNLSQTCSPTAR
jgi:hypothetical protein